MTFTSWQQAGTPAAPYTTASPNMLALRVHLLEGDGAWDEDGQAWVEVDPTDV